MSSVSMERNCLGLPTNLYHVCDKSGAKKLLLKTKPGTYVIRESSSPCAECALSVRTDKAIIHLRIFGTEGPLPKRYFVEAPQEFLQYFSTIKGLLYYYQTLETDLIMFDSERRSGQRIFLSRPLVVKASEQELTSGSSTTSNHVAQTTQFGLLL